MKGDGEKSIYEDGEKQDDSSSLIAWHNGPVASRGRKKTKKKRKGKEDCDEFIFAEESP